jgi:probable HAF family extracellular repeat protein
MTDLGTLGGRYAWSEGVAIDEQGEVSGNIGTESGKQHAFLWRGGKMLDLGGLGGTFSSVVAMSEHAQVVGSSVPAKGSVVHATLWHDRRALDLGTLGGQESDAAAISADGRHIVGVSNTKNGSRHAVLWMLPMDG